MSNLEKIKAKYIAILTFKAIWLIVALLFGGAAIVLMQQFGGIGGWLIAGFACAFPLMIDVLKFAAKGAKEGEIEGANTYTVRDLGSSIRISNSPNAGALKGIIFHVIAFVIVGPILLAVKIFAFVIDVCHYAAMIARLNKDIAKGKN